MLDYLKRLFGFSKPEQTVEAPYKLEAKATVEFIPATPYEPKKCGCGRSETGLCSGLHALSEAEWSTHEKNPNRTPAKKPAAKKATAKAKTTTKATAKAPAKTKAPAKPRAKKAS